MIEFEKMNSSFAAAAGIAETVIEQFEAAVKNSDITLWSVDTAVVCQGQAMRTKFEFENGIGQRVELSFSFAISGDAAT